MSFDGNGWTPDQVRTALQEPPVETMERLEFYESDLERAYDLYSVIAAGGDDEFCVIITVPGAPANKVRPRFTRSGRTYMPKEAREAEEHTRRYMRAAVETPYKGNVAIGCIFYRPNRQRIDTDNMLKHVCDSANGVLWDDDSQATAVFGITELDRENPRTVIVLGRHRSTMTRGTDSDYPCIICGRPISRAGQGKRVKTCSPECAVKLRGYNPLSEPVACAQCGKPFIRESQYRKLCSVECRTESLRGRNKARATPKSRCIDCGKELDHKRGGRCRDCWRNSIRK